MEKKNKENQTKEVKSKIKLTDEEIDKVSGGMLDNDPMGHSSGKGTGD